MKLTWFYLAMLVLTTMFISTSNGLPKTSYVKMIDVWFIYTLTLTLIEVIVTAVLEFLIDDEATEGRCVFTMIGKGRGIYSD